MPSFRLSLLAAFLPLTVSPAATLFSNLTATGTYDGAVGWSIGANFPSGFAGGGSTFTVPFQVSVTSTLDQVIAGVTYCGGTGAACFLPTATNEIILSVWGGSAVAPIGGDILLETFTLAGAMQPWKGQGDAFVSATSSLHPLLNAGQTYWFRVAVPDPATGYAVWGRSLNSQGGISYVSVGGSAFGLYSSSEAAFVILGSPVPEPAAGGLVLIALAEIWRRRRA